MGGLRGSTKIRIYRPSDRASQRILTVLFFHYRRIKMAPTVKTLAAAHPIRLSARSPQSPRVSSSSSNGYRHRRHHCSMAPAPASSRHGGAARPAAACLASPHPSARAPTAARCCSGHRAHHGRRPHEAGLKRERSREKTAEMEAGVHEVLDPRRRVLKSVAIGGRYIWSPAWLRVHGEVSQVDAALPFHPSLSSFSP
jgi:hypothetical protein